MWRSSSLLALCSAIASPAVAQVPIPVHPGSLDLSGAWMSVPEPIPPWVSRIDRTRCDRTARAYDNDHVYAGTRLELEVAGPAVYDIGTYRFLKVPYRGTLYYPQGYGRTITGADVSNDRACAVELFEYALTGELTFNLESRDISFAASGLIRRPPPFPHFTRGGVGAPTRPRGAGQQPVLFVDPSGDEIVLGVGAFDRGGTGDFPGGCDSILLPPFTSYSLTACMPLAGVIHRFRRVSGNLFAIPTGPLRGQVFEGTPDGVSTGNPLSQGRVRVRRQDLPVRARRADETPEAYATWLAEDRRRRPVVAETTLDASGHFTFQDLPLLRRTVAGSTYGALDQLYTVELIQAQKEEIDPNTMAPVTIYFSSEFVDGVSADRLVMVIARPGPPIQQKLDLTDRLIAICPDAFTAPERAVQSYLAPYAAGQPLTGPQAEGLSRAITSERAIAEAADLAKALIELGMGAVGDLLADILSDVSTAPRELREGKEKLEKLKEQRFAEGTRAGHGSYAGWATDEGVVRVSAEMELLMNDTATLRDSDLLDSLKRVVKTAVIGAIKAGAVRYGMSEDEALMVAQLVERYLNPLMEFGTSGDIGEAVRETVKAAVAALGDQLLDAPLIPISFSARTVDALERSRRELMSWPRDDRALYTADRAVAYQHLARFTTEGSQVLAATLYAQQASEGLGAAADVYENGKFVPLVAWAQKVTKWSQRAALAGTAVGSLGHALGSLPESATQASDAAFGRHPARLGRLGRRVAPNPNLFRDYSDAVTGVATALGRVNDDVTRRLFVEALLHFNDRSPTGVRGAMAVAEDRLEAILAEAGTRITDSSTRDGLAAEAAQQHLRTRLALRELGRRVVDIVLTTGGGGAFEAQHEANFEDQVNAVEGSLRLELDRLERLGTASVAPALAIVSVSVSSPSMPVDAKVRSADETFEVTARLRNVSTATVGAVSVELVGVAPLGWLTIDAPIIDVGALSADDGAASGPDERELRWTVARRAPLDADATAQLELRVLEAGDAPRTFAARARSVLLAIDPAIDDPDLDGFSLAEERRWGLDPAVDDGDGDLDADGLTQREEHRLGTRPDRADTDEDGLSDRAELEGAWRTHPQVADSDGDGTLDGADGAPLDPTRVTAATPPTPARLIVEPADAVFDFFHPGQEFTVRSSDGSTVAWTVETDDGDLLDLSVRAPGMSTGRALWVSSSARRPDGTGIVLRVVPLAGTAREATSVVAWFGERGTLAPDAGPASGADGGMGNADADGGTSARDASGDGPTAPSASGCGCTSGRTADSGAWIVLAIAALWRRTARRRALG